MLVGSSANSSRWVDVKSRDPFACLACLGRAHLGWFGRLYTWSFFVSWHACSVLLVEGHLIH